LLTRNGQPISDRDPAHPAHAVLWGLGRSLALEHPEFWGAVIDADESVSVQDSAGLVLAEAYHGDGEDQVVYRSGLRQMPRLQRRIVPAEPAGGIGRSSRVELRGAERALFSRRGAGLIPGEVR